jgi:hypothetical protein
MDDRHLHPFADVESTPGHDAGSVELGYGARPLLCPDGHGRLLAVWLHRKEQTVRQQLREFCYEVEAKRGVQRQALAVGPCFGPLFRWVLSGWQGTQVALALDATSLGTRFTVLAISVVYRGCAIPVAWTILPANVAHAWHREWLRMLRQLRPALPRAWTVIVLADRGLYARWLFRRSPAGRRATPTPGSS